MDPSEIDEFENELIDDQTVVGKYKRDLVTFEVSLHHVKRNVSSKSKDLKVNTFLNGTLYLLSEIRIF